MDEPLGTMNNAQVRETVDAHWLPYRIFGHAVEVLQTVRTELP